MTQWTLDKIQKLDAEDIFAAKRDEFFLPEGLIYLDGNSLGALPRAVAKRLQEVTEKEWGGSLIAGWNVHSWIDLPSRVGDMLAGLIGADPGEVVLAESTSINLFKALTAALQAGPKRGTILTEEGNFPTDLYVLDAIARHSGGAVKIKRVAAAALEENLTDEVAILCLTHSNFKTSRKHNMAALTKAANEVGALTVWDLSHSAGAMPVDLNGCGVDYAIGCGYKYLNSGPGGPGYIFVAKRHQDKLDPVLAGWMGHIRPFDFSGDYEPADGILRQLTGTPDVMGAAALEAALGVFDNVDMAALYRKAQALGDLFLDLVLESCPKLELGCPRNADDRGSQVTLKHAHGYAIIQAVIAKGLVGDFRSPDVLRFGFAPLYNSYTDVWNAAAILAEVMDERVWETPDFQARKKVT